MRYWASERSRWLDIGQVLSCIFINQDEVEVNRNAKHNEANRAIFAWPWNENARTKQTQQTNGNRAIWLVYRTDTNARGYCLVKRTLGWKNFMPENFLEINRYFALTWYCNTIGQSNNAFSILGFSLAGKRIGHVLIVSSIGWQTNNEHFPNHFSRSYENLSIHSLSAGVIWSNFRFPVIILQAKFWTFCSFEIYFLWSIRPHRRTVV